MPANHSANQTPLFLDKTLLQKELSFSENPLFGIKSRLPSKLRFLRESYVPKLYLSFKLAQTAWLSVPKQDNSIPWLENNSKAAECIQCTPQIRIAYGEVKLAFWVNGENLIVDM